MDNMVPMFVIVLAGMAIPIVLLAAAVLFNLCVLMYVAYRIWHDRVRPLLARLTSTYVIRPIAGIAHVRL